MNIQELDSYNLADAVKFNDRLNPRLWDKDEHLKPEVHRRLLEIANDFREFLGVKDLDLRDITISGSNAAYTYTPNSDIDLHLVVDMPENEVYRELFDAKKFQYNEQHNIKIGGYDVELYVQDAAQPHISQGIYSIANNDWIQVPRRVKANVDDASTRNKFETVGHQIEKAIASGSLKQMTRMAEKIKKMRQTGLEQHGEFGPENLAFKILRSQGKIKELYDARNAAKDELLSLDERKKKKKKRKVKYGYGGYWYPGYAYGGQDHSAGSEGGGNGGGESMREDAGMTWDGVNPTTCMFLNEEDPVSDEDILKDFIEFCVKELKIKQMPTVKLRRDPQWSVVNQTFGRYIDEKHLLEVAFGQRHIMDVLRTVAHELTHKHQHERESVPADAGETGSRFENEANARAGVLMRDYGRLHPELFDSGPLNDLEEGWKSKLAGAALAGAAALGSPDVQANTNPVGIARDVGTAVRTAQQMTRAGIQDELSQELRNFIRAQGGDPGSQNQSTLYQWQKRYNQSKKNSQVKAEPQPLPASDDPKANYYNKPEPLLPDIKNESASGYIPTKKQAKDPRYSMALTVDIKPGQVGKEANKLNLKTNKQGQPQIARANGLFEKLALELNQFKRQGTLSESVESLDEVKMSPGTLEKFASSKEAEGIRAGFEAELIFRDTAGDDDDAGDMEPDYDMDERAYSIQQVIEFFQNDDYGYGLSNRQTRSLENELDEQYMNWRDEQMMEDFKNDAEDLVREVWLEERPMNERILSALVDGIGMDDAEADRILAIGDKAPRFTKNSDQEAYKEANPGYDKYLEAVDIADEILDEEVEASIDNQDGYYDQALDNFRDNYAGDDDSFFSDVGLRWMSDIASNFDLSWPYMTGGGSSNYGSRDWDEIGASLRNATGIPVKVSSGYHSQKRGDYYVIEPDGSLDPDDKNEEAGLEIVSPPMPLNQAIEQLQKVIEWANDPEQGNAYTNSSTGLHMGVSIPYKGGDVDYLKLILFMGDKYVLNKFGRAANTYTASAMEKLRQNVAGSKNRGDDKITSALELMKGNLLELAQRYVQQGVGNSKYTSAHIKDGYIEFRSPGGDYLAKADEEIGVLEDTMRRFAYAMYLAGRPDLERPEYYKKLYKLIAPEGNKDLELFSKFSTGEITAEQLKKQWAERTIGKETKTNQRWTLYQFDGNDWTAVPGQSYNGYTEDEVKMRVWSKYGREALDSGEYKLVNMSEEQQWEVYDVKTGQTLEIAKGRNKGEVADAVYDKYVDQGIGFNVRPYVDPTTLTPRAKLAKRIVEPKKQPPPQEQQAKNERGVPYWEVYEKETGHVVHTFLSDDLPDAVTDAYNWLQGIGAEQPDLFAVRAKMVPNPQTTDNRRDSADLQRNLGVQDVDVDVAQNFDQPQDATEVRRNWEFVDRITGQVIHSMTNASYNQANAVQSNLEQQNPAADIYLRSVERPN